MEQQPETIFNLYIYSVSDLITEIGVVNHILQGSDEEKIEFLQKNVRADFANAKKFVLPEVFRIRINGVIKTGIDYTSYRELVSKGHNLMLFEEAFEYFKASPNPLFVITPVKDGYIFIEGFETAKVASSDYPQFVHIDKQKKWFAEYIDSKGFHFDRLIYEDFFDAIKILFSSKHYVSSMKLLMICLDTVSYLEFGDKPKSFQSWLDTYVELDNIKVTSDELWAFRNSILHMTNLDSRKVRLGQVKRLMFHVSGVSMDYVEETEEGKYFNFKVLLDNAALGINKWADSYNIDKNKIEIFVKRYGRIISDKRMTFVYYDKQFPDLPKSEL